MPALEIRAVADNLVEALRFFGQARPDAEIRDLAGVSLIFCGLNYAAFNAALLTRPVGDDARELARLIEVSAAHFDGRRLRWTCWVCDDFMGKGVRRQAHQIFGRHGLRPLTCAPGMYAERLLPPQRPLPAIEIRRVSDAPTRATFGEIMAIAFDIPHSVSTSVYGAEQAWCGEFRGYVGYSNGQPVTTAGVAITGDVVGLYSVATLPQHRRLGFAEAIMRHVIGQARESAGIERTVLQSTSSGLSLYEKMGYRKVTDFDVYIAG
ncbi:MAG TPA: GNAT family N-acetyltransferase [Bryobacteraceae bacterium]|nr:GNAT family N-acetyltransferase [Bryobacteraceae bacterium]